MGWYYGWDRRKDLIGELTKDIRPTGDAQQAISRCLAKCYKGCAHSGTLWSVWEQFRADIPVGRYIRCDVMHYRGGEWGYKPMEETMHPYVYTCPLKYLLLVPPDRYPDAVNAEWRQGVQAHHMRRRANLQARRRRRHPLQSS